METFVVSGERLIMPATDKNKSTSNSTSCKNSLRCTRKPIIARKAKISYDAQLNIPRKVLDHSKRIKLMFIKRNDDQGSRSIENKIDNAWITSGTYGSRDAVLVFRTSILNKEMRNETSTTQLSDDRLESQNDLDETKDNGNRLQYNLAGSCDSIFVSPNSESSASRMIFKGFSATVISDGQSNSRCILAKNNNETITATTSPSTTTTTTTSAKKNDLYPSPSISDEDLDDRENECNEDPIDDHEDRPYTVNMPAVNMKIKYKFMQTETKLLRKIFIRHGLSEVEGDQNFSILWTGVHLKPDILRNLAPYQKVNHFPRSYELTRKDRLYKNIERMQYLRGLKHFDIVPQSFILPLQYRDLVTAHNKCRGPWIVKPAASSRGRGIFIVNSPELIPQEEQVLVSKYISDPLCIDGHKCDLRVYVLVTSFDPLIIYIYEEGLVRLATVKYDRQADNLWNPCMHLCNYSINKYHSDYIKSNDANEEDVGHKWTLSALLRHLKLQGCDTGQLMANIEDLIIKSILACAQSIIAACRMFVPKGNNCFELYGFDILVDSALKPWLLEVNMSPSMGVDSPLDARVKASLVTDLLTCVGIPAYGPAMRSHYDKKWTRFCNISRSRRTNSAEPLGNGYVDNKRSNKKNHHNSPPLTLEEQRIVRNARLQNVRRGGFVRIFPTEDTMQRYGSFLDSETGIPMSTTVTPGQQFCSPILLHNYNQMLFNNLYKESRGHGNKDDNSQENRISQYERALERAPVIVFKKKTSGPKCLEEGKRLRTELLRLIDSGSEMSQLQARQTFSRYLEAIIGRLIQEPRSYHEKLILKFLNQGGVVKTPTTLRRHTQNTRSSNKSHTAMVAKLLNDYLEVYNKDTEAYVDTFDTYGMIPSALHNEFLEYANENDLEVVLTLHTNLTGTMPFLYNRCGLFVPRKPPIPTGSHGFLKALPAMVGCASNIRDSNYKNDIKTEKLGA